MSDIDPNGAGLVQEHLDTLTGLLNRVGVEACLASQERISPPPALGALAVELSRFGYINDSVGSVLADRIIALVSRRLRKVFSHAALIGRTHGDHFCLVFAHGENLDEQVGLLQDFVQRPLAVHGEIIVLSVRIGVAETGAEVASPSRLLHAAEVALHRAKRSGSKHCRYAAELEEEARETHKLENDLRVSLVTRSAELHQAISNDEFTLLYQPIIDLHSGGVHACEALIRWHHPLRGLIAPDEFIPMAEKIQVMDVLGNWIVRRACRDAVSWPANPDGSLVGVSINISPTQFIEPPLLVATVRLALADSGIDPHRVKLELTESSAFTPNMDRVLHQLRALGCRLALDDFGSGYSSLTQLSELPLDYVKLDRSFVRHLASTDDQVFQRSERLTRAILALAATLELTPIVEGVETAGQLERIRGFGAHLIQGFHCCRPLPPQAVAPFIARPAKELPHD